MISKPLLERTINEYKNGIDGLKNSISERFLFKNSVPWFAIDNEKEIFDSFVDATIAISEKRLKELEEQLTQLQGGEHFERSKTNEFNA